MPRMWCHTWRKPSDEPTLMRLSLALVVPNDGHPSGYFWWVALDRQVGSGWRSVVDGKDFPLTLAGYEEAKAYCRALARQCGGGKEGTAPSWEAVPLVRAEMELSLGERNRIVAMLEGRPLPGVSPQPSGADYAALVGGGRQAGAFAFSVSRPHHAEGVA